MAGPCTLSAFEIAEHVVEREFLHFFASGSVFIIALWGFWVAERKLPWWPQLKGWSALMLPALASSAIIFIREPGDAHNNPCMWWKSYVDLSTWLVSLSVHGWALYRLSPRLEEIVDQIQASRRKAA